MNSLILSKTYKGQPFCEKEILRYAGCKEADSETLVLLKNAIDDVESKLEYKVCYRELQLEINSDCCDFGIFSLESKNLAINLNGCDRAIVFAATIGVEIDRLIVKYGHISPAKALVLQAIGAERIESLCDEFCADIKAECEVELKPRFSPGYGDLPLESQKELFKILTPEKHIGLTLTDSLLMSPSKSVTAIVGLCEKNVKNAR